MKTPPNTNVPRPDGAVSGDVWEPADTDGPAHRVVFGREYRISDGRVQATAMQLADGSIDHGLVDVPHIIAERIDYDGHRRLDADEARKIARAFLDAADLLDKWGPR